MSLPSNSPGAKKHAVSGDCWNRIGVRGDSSCKELEQHVHCRNCPLYSAAAAGLLDREPAADYLSGWTRQVAQQSQAEQAATHSVVIFRIGAEWLALPSALFREISSVRAIHSIPHRRNGVVAGLVNIRGELLVCISLEHILGLEPPAVRKRDSRRAPDGRLLVIEREGSRTAAPVDEVFGIQRYDRRELTEVPATISNATGTYTKAVLPWRKKSVGVLDEQLLFYTFNRSLALATAT
jgi:chemotaxis-related protein WspD